QEEPAREGLGEGVMGGCGVLGAVHPYAGDAGGNYHSAGGVEQIAGTLEHAASVGEPQRAGAELLELGGCLHDPRALAPEMSAPYADPAKFHVSRLHCTGGRVDAVNPSVLVPKFVAPSRAGRPGACGAEACVEGPGGTSSGIY